MQISDRNHHQITVLFLCFALNAKKLKISPAKNELIRYMIINIKDVFDVPFEYLFFTIS